MTFREHLRPVKSSLRRASWALIRSTRGVRPPVNADGRLLVHLGCGPINAPGYTNVDVKPFPHVHYAQDVYPLKFLRANSADLVYASHVLEHFPFTKVPDILREWRRVLKIGGILRLAVPNFRALFDIYAETKDLRSILGPLMGGQSDPYNFHYCAYDRKSLTELLETAGFRHIRTWDPLLADHHDFQDTSAMTWPSRDGRLPISLNIEAVK